MKPIEITGLKNSRIKEVVKLRDRKQRDKTKLTVIEGVREVIRAREADVTLEEIYFCEEFLASHMTEKAIRQLMTLETKLFRTNADVFRKISFGDRHEGLLALGRQPALTFKDLKLTECPLVVVLEHIEKPGNLGAILRTCDGAGVDAVLVCDSATDLYNPNVIRSSIGTVFSLNLVQTCAKEACSFLKKNNIKIFATIPGAGESYAQKDFTVPSAFVLGSEQKGLSDFWTQKADEQIAIPMKGQGDSLNVSVTSAVVIYEALRQREL